MKFILIGAGSMAFSQSLISAIGCTPEFRGCTVGLVDVNEESLDIMKRLTNRLVREMDWDINFEASTDRRELLPGADAVAVTIAVGGFDAYEKDILIPTKYGYVQSVGDTTGPGGLIRAMRHVPVMMDIARDVKELCPGARFYNYTNPMTILTQAVNRIYPATGLCMGPELTKQDFCRFADIDEDGVTYYVAGLNHCHVLLSIHKDGKDLYPIGRQKIRDILSTPGGRESYPESIRAHWRDIPFNARLMDVMGYLPGPMDNHVMEYFPQFINSNDRQRKEYPCNQSYYNSVLEHHPKKMAFYRGIADGTEPINKEDFTRQTGEETELISIELALRSDKPKLFHLNIPNKDYISDIPNGIPVEIPVFVDEHGYHPVAVGALPAAFAPTVARATAKFDLTIDAALEGCRSKVMQVFLNDPACNDIDIAEKCLNEMIDAQLKWLPNFK